MKPSVAAILIGLASLASQAEATTMDDYLQRGYVVLLTTRVAGVFMGCQRSATVVFADGTRFRCSRAVSEVSVAPRVSVLRRLPDQATAVVVGSRALDGVLIQLGSRLLPAPLPVNGAAPAEVPGPALPTAAPTRMEPINPVRSLNQLQSDLSRPLNELQDTVPVRPRRSSPGTHTLSPGQS